MPFIAPGNWTCDLFPKKFTLVKLSEDCDCNIHLKLKQESQFTTQTILAARHTQQPCQKNIKSCPTDTNK